MAAVFCFVFLFALAACALLFKVFFAASLTSVFAGIVFVLLAGGLFVGMFKLAKGWEHEAGEER